MSGDDVEILRRTFEAFNRGGDDAWIAAWHPEARETALEAAGLSG